jgi:hypothetical protein
MNQVVICAFMIAASGGTSAEGEALRAAYLEWQANVAFKGTFQLRAGISRSRDDAVQLKFDPQLNSPSSNTFEGNGEIAKLGSSIRYRIDYGPIVRLDKMKTFGLPFDESTNGEVVVSYSILRDNIGNVATVMRHPASLGRSAAGPQTATELSPLNLLKSNDGLFSNMKLVTVTPIDDGHVVVDLERADVAGVEYLRQITFATAYELPVVEKVADKYRYKGKSGQAECLASDFQNCPGGMVPRRLLFFLRPLGAQNFLVRHWTSTNLGDETPTEDDFVITVPATTSVIGLKQPLPQTIERRLDPHKLNINAIYTELELEKPQPLGGPDVGVESKLNVRGI